MCKKWPMATAPDVKNNMQEHFSPDLFSPSDIADERGLLRKLLHDCYRMVRFEREVEQQKANKSDRTVLSQDTTSSTPDVEVGEDQPTMSSDVSVMGADERSAKATHRA
ncbi:unnamed protein product [Ectocarpus sp. 4 AP-2014]